MQQIVCPKCKARVDASLNFCPGCGSALPLPNSRGGNSGEKLTQVNQQHLANAEVSEENPEESMAEPVASEVVITAEKPDDWSDIYVYVYTDDMFKNANWPGEIMTANGDGTYSYAISSSFADKNTFLVFSTSQLNKGAKLSKQFPYMSDNGYSLSEKNTFTVSDFETYANEKAKK